MNASSSTSLGSRLGALDWPALREQIKGQGYALSDPLLTPQECSDLIALYGDDARFRKRIVMERYRYGLGDYAYFNYPLPPLVQALRERLYAELASVANAWSLQLSRGAQPPPEYPSGLAEFLEQCHAVGQVRPTPLLLQYGQGGYNCLHQDLYGALAFPLQATLFLCRPTVDYQGGEFLLVEQRPRQQSRGTAILPQQGACVIFPSAIRPVMGSRGVYRATMRHGVSTITGGQRYTLGIIFHDAE
jgi:hypothetical protein